MKYCGECKSKDYKIILTGHSLGGTVAEHVSSHLYNIVDHCESFNPGN